MLELEGTAGARGEDLIAGFTTAAGALGGACARGDCEILFGLAVLV